MYRVERTPVHHKAGYDEFTMKTLTEKYPHMMSSRIIPTEGNQPSRSSTFDDMMMGEMFTLAPDFPVVRGTNEKRRGS